MSVSVRMNDLPADVEARGPHVRVRPPVRSSRKASRLFQSFEDRTPDSVREKARELSSKYLDDEAGLPLAPGDAVGNYEVIEILGSGGQAVVYRAKHRHIGRMVALKVPRREVGDRLLREAKLSARLEHPRIVRVEDIQLDGPVTYMVLELCEGGSLDERLDSAPEGLPLEEVRKLSNAILNALHFAHSRGVIHRDVKPANVLFGRDGKLKVADFGIGTVSAVDGLSASIEMSQVSLLAGTPLYVAPEQERPELRENGKLDGRADLFSFGKMLFQMLTGASPRTIRPPSRVRKDLDPAWDEYVFKLIEERPEDRFPDAKTALASMPKAEKPVFVPAFQDEPVFQGAGAGSGRAPDLSAFAPPEGSMKDFASGMGDFVPPTPLPKPPSLLRLLRRRKFGAALAVLGASSVATASAWTVATGASVKVASVVAPQSLAHEAVVLVTVASTAVVALLLLVALKLRESWRRDEKDWDSMPVPVLPPPHEDLYSYETDDVTGMDETGDMGAPPLGHELPGIADFVDPPAEDEAEDGEAMQGAYSVPQFQAKAADRPRKKRRKAKKERRANPRDARPADLGEVYENLPDTYEDSGASDRVLISESAPTLDLDTGDLPLGIDESDGEVCLFGDRPIQDGGIDEMPTVKGGLKFERKLVVDEAGNSAFLIPPAQSLTSKDIEDVAAQIENSGFGSVGASQLAEQFFGEGSEVVKIVSGPAAPLDLSTPREDISETILKPKLEEDAGRFFDDDRDIDATYGTEAYDDTDSLGFSDLVGDFSGLPDDGDFEAPPMGDFAPA